jgi:hypothetical protein
MSKPEQVIIMEMRQVTKNSAVVKCRGTAGEFDKGCSYAGD